MYLKLVLVAVVLMAGFGCATDQAGSNVYNGPSMAPPRSGEVNCSVSSVSSPVFSEEFAYQMTKAQEKPVEKSNRGGCTCGFF